MKKYIIPLLLICPLTLFADQWKILGVRPMGMGGAFVAMAQGPIAQYWNPAGLAQSTNNPSGFELPVSAGIEMTGGIMKNASEIGDLADKFSAIKTAQTNGTALNADQVAAFAKTVSLLADMNKPGKGALIETAAGANFKFSKVAVSVNNYTTIGLNPYIDTVNIGLGNATGVSGVNFSGGNMGTPGTSTQQTAAATIGTAINAIGFGNIETLICGTSGCLASQISELDTASELANVIVNQAVTSGLSDQQILEAANTMSQYASQAAPIIANAASGNPYTNNQSDLSLAGGSFTEIAFGYGKYFQFLPGLSIGGNLKAVQGKIGATNFKFMDESDTKDFYKDFLDNAETSWKPAADIGFLWQVKEKYPNLPFNPRVGLVIRNINSPKFDGPSGDYKLERQARIGFALSPVNFWHLALDMDLTKNKTSVDGFDSKVLAMGTEINIVNRKAFNIPLRAGLSKNMAEKDSKTAFSLGTGLNLLYMHFDISAQMSSDKTEIEGTKYPNKLNIAAGFGILF